MDPLTLGLIGSGAGFLKYLLVDKPASQRDAILEAAKARYSPWTGIKPGEVKQADPLSGIMQGGMSGAMLGQGLSNMNAQQKMQDALTSYFGGKASAPSSQAMSLASPMAAGSPPLTGSPSGSLWDTLMTNGLLQRGGGY